MAQELTILYGQIANYSHSPEYDTDIQFLNSSLIKTLCEKYNGQIIFSTQNQFKISFNRPVNAVQFALNAFERFVLESKIPCKIGIAFAENTTVNNTVFDLAFSLSEICPDGAILLSKDIVSAIGSDSTYNFKYIGGSLFKGMDESVEIFALAEENLYIPIQDELFNKTRNKNSIAILPFHNTSSERELDYICDGIAEEIIDSLSKVKALFVTARTSSFMFKNKEISIQDISRKLNVNFVLNGSIRKRNDEYRISYQLVDSTTGYNLLSESFSSDFDNLYNSEKKISEKIISHLNPNEKLSKDTDDIYINPVAYSYYLKGKFLINQWNKYDAYKAIENFNKALEIVPDYALAYAGLSSAYIHIVINGFAEFKPNVEKAVEYAELSINADNSIPDGYVAKAVATFFLGNLYLPDLEKNITTALTISPCNAEIRMYNGMVFLFKGNLKRALSELKLAKQLDPYSNPINLRLGVVQYLNKDYQDAHNTFLSQLKEDSYKTNYLLRLTKCCYSLKHYNKALEYLSKASKDDTYYGIAYACYLIIYKNLKDEDKFFKYKSIIENQEKTDPSYAYNHAVLNYIKGNKELAIHFLEMTLQDPMTILMFFQYDTFWKDLHDHPLFIKQIVTKYKGTGNQLIKIESDTKEFIELCISDFLYAEAQDNYTLIVYKEKERKIEKILRTTLANVEKQLSSQEVIRCHRSYIINSASGYTFHKSDNKAFLKSTEMNISVPVSRSKEKEIKEMLQS